MAASNAEIIPTKVTIPIAACVRVNKGNNLATRYTPATTIVAAWINAETGVGPSIASGNQICSGNIALLPAPPIKTNTRPHVSAVTPTNDAVVIAMNWDDCCSVRSEEHTSELQSRLHLVCRLLL